MFHTSVQNMLKPKCQNDINSGDVKEGNAKRRLTHHPNLCLTPHPQHINILSSAFFYNKPDSAIRNINETKLSLWFTACCWVLTIVPLVLQRHNHKVIQISEKQSRHKKKLSLRKTRWHHLHRPTDCEPLLFFFLTMSCPAMWNSELMSDCPNETQQFYYKCSLMIVSFLNQETQTVTEYFLPMKTLWGLRWGRMCPIPAGSWVTPAAEFLLHVNCSCWSCSTSRGVQICFGNVHRCGAAREWIAVIKSCVG